MFHLFIISTLILASLFFPTLAFATNKDANENKPSEIAVMPFVWATGLKGSIGFGDISVDLDVPVQDLVSGVEAGGMGLARWNNETISLNFEAIRLEFKDPSFEPLNNLRVSSDLTYFSGSLGYILDVNIGEKKGNISMNAGLNYTEINGVVSSDLFSQRLKESWIDPTIGFVAELPMSHNWTLFGKADASGIVTDNTLISLALVGQRKVSNHMQLNFGYRYAHAEFPSPSASGFGFQLEGHGPLVGVSAKFGL